MDKLKFVCCVYLLGIVADINAMNKGEIDAASGIYEKKERIILALKNSGFSSSQMHMIKSAVRKSKIYQLDRQRLIQFNEDYKLNPNQACNEMMSYLIKNNLTFCGQQMGNLDPSQVKEFKNTINEVGATYGWPNLNLISQLCDNLPEHVSNLVREYYSIISGED